MIENVARAICAASGDDPDALCMFPDNDPKWVACIPEAKAAIAAMQQAQQWQGIESAQRSLLDQIKHDAALVAALSEHERRNYERELKSLFCNPGITFPTPPAAGGSDAE